MRNITLTICAICLVGSQFCYAQTEAEMKAWQNYMTPGKPHEMMAKWNGTWNGEISMWMAPNAPPTKTTGTSENKMVMGGRYQVATHKGNVMGMPFEGMSTLAYDNAKKIFISSWIDNMGTGIMNLEGPWDEATKTITLTGKMVEPTTGKEVDVKEVFKVLDDNTNVMEMYAKGTDGNEFKTMQIKYTRKQ